MPEADTWRYWINTVSRDHVMRGVEGGFTQADHGRATRLRKLARGDLLVFYSPRTAYPSGDPLQSFTALGRVADDEPYQVEMTPTFKPWRRTLDILSTTAAPIRPLIADLGFISDKKHWGAPFRMGLFPVSEPDFLRIARAMGVEDL
jgi:hypothetical protein